MGMRRGETEPPFTGAYWDHHEEGTYTCIVCDAPLFTSETKFESGTGWPSFHTALPDSTGTEIEADGRLEVHCASCNQHLGHLFPDGPFGQRYCINSKALNFQHS